MNPSISSLKKAVLFSAALFLGRAAQAQSAGTTTHTVTDTTWQKVRGMRRVGGGGFDRGGGGFARGGFNRNEFRDHKGRGPAVRYTPEQRRQVMAINKEYQQKSEDLFKKDNSTLREYKAGLLALQKEKKSKLEALLTQKQKDEKLARTKRMSENGQVMAAARMERLKLRLNLSDDQVAKIKAGQETLRNQAKAIHENDNLLPQQKMEQMKDLAARRNDVVKSVLTPEQQTQFEKMSHRRPGGFGGQRRQGRGGDDRRPGNGPGNGGEETK